MDKALDREVRRLARNRCEYCHLPESASRLSHVLDHIIARQHGGEAKLDNLALCCGRCNQFKGPNIASIDFETKQLTRLFHTRVDDWAQHFKWNGPVLAGISAIGRVTISILNINLTVRIAVRRALMADGFFPPE